MTVRSYPSPAAFKQALEQRLRDASRTGPDLARRRQLLVFDRFLARVVDVFGDAAMLKWERPYTAMVQADQLAWPSLADVTEAVKAFLDPVLAGGLVASWKPSTWAWTRR